MDVAVLQRRSVAQHRAGACTENGSSPKPSRVLGPPIFAGFDKVTMGLHGLAYVELPRPHAPRNLGDTGACYVNTKEFLNRAALAGLRAGAAIGATGVTRTSKAWLRNGEGERVALSIVAAS